MTLSLNKIKKILQEKRLKLNQTDIEKINFLFKDLNLDEKYIIDDVNEIIRQIQITPRNDEVIEN